MPDLSITIDGKKYMWDSELYPTREEALERMKTYEDDGFEVELQGDDRQFLLYTRRVVTEIVLDDES